MITISVSEQYCRTRLKSNKPPRLLRAVACVSAGFASVRPYIQSTLRHSLCCFVRGATYNEWLDHLGGANGTLALSSLLWFSSAFWLTYSIFAPSTGDFTPSSRSDSDWRTSYMIRSHR